MYKNFKQSSSIVSLTIVVALLILVIGCTPKKEVPKTETPKGFGFTIHKVSSFADWMFGFEKGLNVRVNGGVKSTQIFNTLDDTNNVAVLTGCVSTEALKKFLDSEALKEAMKKGAVVGEPAFYFLEEVDKGSVIDQECFGSKLYTVTILNVEDLKKWKVDFDANTEMRKNGGQGAFHLFRNVDIPNQIALFIEWENLEKAETFLKSDDLKEANERSGVTEMVVSYFFNEVKKETL